jgi:hypothetical protein
MTHIDLDHLERPDREPPVVKVCVICERTFRAWTGTTKYDSRMCREIGAKVGPIRRAAEVLAGFGFRDVEASMLRSVDEIIAARRTDPTR